MSRQRFANLYATAFAVLAAVVVIAPPTWADEAKTAFNIPAQDLSSALREFARQSKREILFSSEVAQGKSTKGVMGDLGADAALTKLLAGTGLVVAKSANGTTLVTTPDAKEASGSLGPPIAPGGATNNAHLNSPGNEADTVRAAQLEEVVVTGSRIPLTAGQQSVQPVRSYTRDDIERSGQSTLAEYLTTLPDVTHFNNFTGGLYGVQPVQLHGLPAGTTLTLMDGRRLETNEFGIFDVSNIPASAIERIEILPVGASAIYGADALGGAVNLILRKNFTGFEINASLDHAPGVNNPGVNLAWGRSWERGAVSLIASYDRRGELVEGQRALTSQTQPPAFVTAAQASAIAGNQCAPGTVYSVDGNNLPGLSSPFAAIPAGIIGKPTIAQFVPTAGKQNVCNGVPNADITPASHRESALLSAHYQLTESVDLFTQVLFSRNHQEAISGGFIAATVGYDGTLAANNPYNPFGQDVNVTFENPNYGILNIQPQSFIQPTIGLRGDMFFDWHYELTASLSRDRIRQQTYASDAQAISNALASSDPVSALNPFTTGAPGPAQLIQSLRSATDYYDFRLDDRNEVIETVARGPLFSLPAGALQAVLGAEYRREKQDTYSIGPGFVYTNPLARRAYGVYSEVRVPLLAGGADLAGGERLSLTAAARYDHSNDFGGKVTWQGGMQWRMSNTLSLSGGYGKSYAAPQLEQIAGPVFTSSGPLNLVDPFRGNELATYSGSVASGPNLNLKPETGDSLALKLEYRSDSRHGLHASLTWYTVNIANYIGIPQLQTLVSNPALYPGAIIRAPATPQDQQQGFLGQIIRINELYYNYGDVHLAGIDADLSYALDTPVGRFTPSVAIAELHRWQSALAPGSPAIDGLGRATLFGVGWAPRWKGTASLAWNRGPLSANFAGRYTGRYLDYQDFVPNTNVIGKTWICDAGVRMDIGKLLAPASPSLARFYISLAAVNVFNKTPPFSYYYTWYDAADYDPRGRFLRLSVGTRF